MNDRKGLYSYREIYHILVLALKTMPYMRKAKKSGLLSHTFIERIMLAVTEVNGCPICSYGHTKVAIDAGMAPEEINHLLQGDLKDIPKQERMGVLFAQHYADRRGKPSKQTWDSVVDYYGKELALGILGATRAIMMGNAYGIIWSALFNRIRGQKDVRSNLKYEWIGLLYTTVIIPVAIIQVIYERISKK